MEEDSQVIVVIVTRKYLKKSVADDIRGSCTTPYTRQFFLYRLMNNLPGRQ